MSFTFLSVIYSYILRAFPICQSGSKIDAGDELSSLHVITHLDYDYYSVHIHESLFVHGVFSMELRDQRP